MHLPTALEKISLHKNWRYSTPYPPLGFHPIFENELGNGDSFGLYWPIGRENFEPIVAETWHDEWIVQPTYSSLNSFLIATGSADDEYPEPPSIVVDPTSPRACYCAAKECIQSQNFEAAIPLLETALSVLPEYTDALSLLWAQYVRVGRTNEAIDVAIRAVISPPSFGAIALKPLRWLRSQSKALDFENDPIWQSKENLKLIFGGAKENSDYVILLNAIKEYLAQDKIVRAITLMQTYAELMDHETIAFQERQKFKREDFIAWQIEVSEKFLGCSRNVLL